MRRKEDGGATVRNLTQVGLPSGQFYATWSSGSNPDLFLRGVDRSRFR